VDGTKSQYEPGNRVYNVPVAMDRKNEREGGGERNLKIHLKIQYLCNYCAAKKFFFCLKNQNFIMYYDPTPKNRIS
jgi:hypothetical protein